MNPEATHRRDIYFALRTRVLTDAEMDEAKEIGFYLAIGEETFKQHEKMLEYSDALFKQGQLRLIAKALGE